ncbi:MAG: hypothetical protein WCG21_00945 [Eubacteriales bacterium]
MRVIGNGISYAGNNIIIGKIAAAVIVCGFLLLSVSGCIGTDFSPPVEDSAVTQSPENVARVFAEAAFKGDYEKMFLCFPVKYQESLTENDLEQYKSWGLETKAALEKSGTEYLGTSSGNSSQYSKDKTSAEYKDSLASISMTYGIASTDIDDVRTCDVRIFCNIDKSRKYQDISVLVYKYGTDWYACVNADFQPS